MERSNAPAATPQQGSPPGGDPQGGSRQGNSRQADSRQSDSRQSDSRRGHSRQGDSRGGGSGQGDDRQGLRRQVGLLPTTMAILRKELTVELRTLESVPGMVLFSLSTFVIFHFALSAESVSGKLAAGIFWVTILFASLLAVNRLFVADAEQGGFDSLLMAPVDHTAALLAKLVAMLAYLAALEVVALPAFALLLLGPSPWPHLPALVGVIALADLGLAVIGTFVAALAVRTRARDLIGPLIALPLIVPIAIGASGATVPLMSAGHAGVAARWLLLLGLYDLIFSLIAYAVFDFLLED